jgi:hypothetical protein
MGTLNSETVDALNMLLEDVRASVEIEVALSNGATEFLEREALTVMGVEDTLIAFLLRDWLESLNLPVTRRINGIVLQALDLTRYDDRLQLFVQHQLASRDQAEQLLAEEDIPSDGVAILRSLIAAHIRHAAWCDQRAREFAETRQLEFRRPIGRPRDVDPGASGAVEGDPLPDAPSDAPDTSGARNAPRAVAPVMAEPGMDDAVDAPDGSSIE